MALNHTNPGAQPHDSAPGPVALNRTTPGPQDRQYSVGISGHNPRVGTDGVVAVAVDDYVTQVAACG